MWIEERKGFVEKLTVAKTTLVKVEETMDQVCGDMCGLEEVAKEVAEDGAEELEVFGIEDGCADV